MLAIRWRPSGTDRWDYRRWGGCALMAPIMLIGFGLDLVTVVATVFVRNHHSTLR